MTTALGHRRITPTGLLVTEATDGPDWIEARSHGIGSSDAAAILGMSPWKNRLGLWLEKTGQVVDDRDSRAMQWGHHLEDGIARGFAHETGRQITPSPGVLMHELHPFVRSSVDRLIVEDGTPASFVECKNVDGSKAKEWDPEEGLIPPVYYVQVQHQMLTTGFDRCWVAALIAGNRPTYLEVERDDVFLERLLAEEIEFWDLVQRGEKPWGDATALDYDTLRAVRRSSGKKVEAVGADAATARALRVELDALAAQKSAIEAQKKAIEAAEKALQAKVLDLLGDGEALKVGDQTLFTYKEQTRAAQAPSSFRVLRRPKLAVPADLQDEVLG